MKGGKKRNSNIDTVQQSSPPPSHLATVTGSADDATQAVDEDRGKNSEDSGQLKDKDDSLEEEEADEEDSEAEKDYDPTEDTEIFAAVEAEGERTKLADGYYEIEAVRRKRVRKGQVQYLIKWRGWSEAENTWEPVKNLMQCSDIIDAFEESIKAGKSRSTRKRKRKTAVTQVQTKKKNPQQQQRSPAAATYNVPSHTIKIAEEPMSTPRITDSSCMNESEETNANGLKSVETSKKGDDNGGRVASVVREEDLEQNELNLKLCELKGVMVAGVEDADRFATTSQEDQQIGGDTPTNRLRKTEGGDPVLIGRCTGAKRRKSGSVKRFKKDPEFGHVDDAPNGVCSSLVPVNVQNQDLLGNSTSCKSKYEDTKSLCTITELVKPISYKTLISNNVQEVLVTFEAVRYDGTKVIVDNKFLKANNPLLLIDFYEKHLRYNPT